jgi:hypothetical protein
MHALPKMKLDKGQNLTSNHHFFFCLSVQFSNHMPILFTGRDVTEILINFSPYADVDHDYNC